MISRSRRVATPAERGHDDVPLLDGEDEDEEPARAEHWIIPDTVERDGVPYQLDRCAKCGIWAPRTDGVCQGANRTLAEFDNGE
jgi:hypothetical protein